MLQANMRVMREYKAGEDVLMQLLYLHGAQPRE